MCLPFIVSSGAGGRAFDASGPARGWLWSSGRVFPPFCPLSCFACGALSLKYALISHFKGVFRGFYGVRVGLFVLGGLRGLCGFCTRVELGGFGACCVFCLSFSPFALVFAFLLVLCSCFYLVSCLLCSGCLLLVLLSALFVLVSLWVLCFLFPLRTIRKERAQRFCSLRPLLSCCGCSLRFRQGPD